MTLSPQQRLIAFIGLCAAIFSLSTFGATFWGPFWGLILPAPILVLAFLLKRMFLPRISVQTRLRLTSLSLLYAASVLYFLPSSPISVFVIEVISEFLEPYGIGPLRDPSDFNLIALLIVCGSIVGLNIIWDSKIIAQPARDLKDENLNISAREFGDSLNRYCVALLSELDRYDREVNWSDTEFTPLEAEVEAERSLAVRPRIASDLIRAIRLDPTSSVFVILGDPGSGKSVALRRLVRALCNQAQRTGIVPVYVNLREYPAEREPTTENIVEFVREMARQQTGRDGRAFLDTWYNIFRKNGGLFFVIDSFDELPSVLDCDDKSDSHQRISASFDRFFTQEVQSCKSVIASRHFRAPVGVKGTRLIIRPFRERKIRKAMQTWLSGRGIDADAYVRRLFRDRPQLAPLLRNPFTAELIADYARTNGPEQLPEGAFQIFDDYITTRLEDDKPTLDRLKVTPEKVRLAAATIARAMYERDDIGLEVDVELVHSFLEATMGDHAEKLTEALRYARIVRIGGSDRRRFSFVHRRFAEFFVVEGIQENGRIVKLQSIPTDSRWRDCLVMYCTIATQTSRKEIADYCWSVIDRSKEHLFDGNITASRDAVHCLRFLRDSFQSHDSSLNSFRQKLSRLLVRLLQSPDPLLAKIAAEGIPLLDQPSQREAIVSAFKLRSAWVRDTAFNSCRHLGNLSRETADAIRRHIRYLPTILFLQRFGDLNFSLSLSEAFRRQRRLVWIDLLQLLFIALMSLAILIVYLEYPLALLCIIICTALSVLVYYHLDLGQREAALVGPSSSSDSEEIESPGGNNRGRIEKVLRRFITPRPNDRLQYYMYRTDWMAIGLILFVFAGLALAQSYDSAKLAEFLGRFSVQVSVADFSVPSFLVSVQSGIFFPIFILIVMSWSEIIETIRTLDWRNLFKTIRALDWHNLLERLLGEVRAIMLPVVIIGGIVLLLSSIYYLFAEAITEWFGWVFDVLPYFVWIPMILLVLASLGFAAIRSVWVIVDRAKFRRYVCPEVMAWGGIYLESLSFRSNSMRRIYLQNIRQNRVSIRGRFEEPPAELLDDHLVAEELGRLREQWYGLAT